MSCAVVPIEQQLKTNISKLNKPIFKATEPLLFRSMENFAIKSINVHKPTDLI